LHSRGTENRPQQDTFQHLLEVREEEILYNIMNKDVTRRNLDSSSIH
jgi:hypothetical protein